MSSITVPQQLAENAKNVKNLAEPIKKAMNAANDEDQTNIQIYSQLIECCQTTAEDQFNATKLALEGFASIVKRVEDTRNPVFSKVRSVAETFLVSPAQNANSLIDSLKKRADILKKVETLPPPEKDQKANKHSSIRLAGNSLNSACIHETRSWMHQLNIDVKKSLREYASAQMEFATHSLEAWSKFYDGLTILDFSSDVDDMITLLEEGKLPEYNFQKPKV